MSKDPAFLFYPSDFLTGTMFMNNEQMGIYIKLLCSQHQHGGIIDKISFNTLVGENLIIKSKFIETETGFYNERLTEEMDKRNKKSNNMSETAKEVWKNRKIQLYNKSKENEYNCNKEVNKKDTIVIQTVNVNEDVIINKNIVKNKKETEKLIFPFDSENFKKSWETLMTLKSWSKKPFTALQASLKKLSKYSENEAIQMIENSIEGNYQGLFEIKNYGNSNKQQSTGYDPEALNKLNAAINGRN